METFILRIESDEDPVGQGLGIIEQVVKYEEFETLHEMIARAKQLRGLKLSLFTQI